MVIHRFYPNKTETVQTIAGSWAGNTPNMVASLLHQVYVKATNPLTTFDVILTDKENVQIRRWLTATELVNDLTPTPTEGVYTLSIENASADEEFTVLMQFLEASY